MDLSSCSNIEYLNTLDKRFKFLWGKWRNSENAIWEYKPDGSLIGLNATGRWRIANGILNINGGEYEVVELTEQKYVIKSLNQKKSTTWEAIKISSE